MGEPTDAKILQFGRPATRPSRPAPTTPAAPRGRQAVTAQQAAHRAGYAKAQDEQLIAAGKVIPARITLALDSRELEGPHVDLACGTYEGNPAGDVDMWELALAVPTATQVSALALLTRYPVAWFYRPLPAGPLLASAGIVCWRSGPKGGGRRHCTPVGPDVVDDRGVLLYGGQPRTPPSPQGALF